MRTTFRQRSSASPWGRRLAYVLVVLLAGGAAFYFLRAPTISLVRPLWQGENAVARGFGNLLGFFRSKDSLVNENRLLRERLASLEALEVSHRALESSRDEILAQFGRADQGSGIAAGVLAHPPATPYDILVVDAGSRDGIAAGARVSLPEGGALGRVVEVYEREARVTLYSSSGSETEAVLERGGTPVTLAGRGGGDFEFALPRDAAVEPGDRVLLPGLRSELLAVVEDIRLEPTDSEKLVLARSVANVSSLRFVIIEP